LSVLPGRQVLRKGRGTLVKIIKLTAVVRTYLSSGAGFVAAATGWTAFFAICAIAAIPSLLLLAWLQARGHFSGLDKKN